MRAVSAARCRFGVLASILLLAACGSLGDSAAGPLDVFRDFARAAEEQDGDRMWELMSARMKEGLPRRQFASPAILRTLRQDYASVASGEAVLEVELDDDLALAAVKQAGAGPGARATLLRREQGEWRVQLSELDLVYGAADLEFLVNAPRSDRRAIEVRAWINDTDAVVTRAAKAPLPTFQLKPTEPPPAGENAAVAYVEAGPRAGAIAWTFDR
jgi:hypothetical protein